MRFCSFILAAFLLCVLHVYAVPSTPCSSLIGLTLSNGTASVVFATHLPAGSNFTGDSVETSYNIPQTDLPSLCRVALKVQTSPNSSAVAEVWLPEPQKWNTRFLAVGNGGFAGGVNYPDIVWGVRKNFATMSTNTGHNSTSSDGSWLGNADEVINWGHRALHFTVTAAKEVVNAYYTTASSYSYYAGCSTGGRQGLDAAQRYPSDFNGVLSGSAIAWQTHTSAWQTYVALLQFPNNRSTYIPETMWPAIHSAVLDQCDGIDGFTDGVIMDPSKCSFHPEVLLCGRRGVNASACLTPDQVMNLGRMYTPWSDDEGHLINPGLSPGGELGYGYLMNGATPQFGPTFYRNAIINDSNWDWSTMSVSTVRLADEINPGGSNAYNPDMRPFEALGGKIIHYHGYADPLIPSLNAAIWYDLINYFYAGNGMVEDVEKFYRLFMVPGMGHCSGGVGPWVLDGASQSGVIPPVNSSSYSMLYSLVDWVENSSSSSSDSNATENSSLAANTTTSSSGGGPEMVIGTKYINDTSTLGVQFTRPICRWPDTATYNGAGGSVDTAESWTCTGAGVY